MFNNRPLTLYRKLFISIGLCSVLTIFALFKLSEISEYSASKLSAEHQQQLRQYADEAGELLKKGEGQALQAWLERVRAREQTKVAILNFRPEWADHDDGITDVYGRIPMGRKVTSPIHLEHTINPVIELPLSVDGYRLMVQLPDHMRPGNYWYPLQSVLLVGITLAIIGLLVYYITRHIIVPLKTIQQAAHQVRDGHYRTGLTATLGRRRDELADLAASIDDMAGQVDKTLQQQRQLIRDISHELRTPLTRLRLALETREPEVLRPRIEREIEAISALVEDTLALAWLDNGQPLARESFDLCSLMDSLIADARFEFPDTAIHTRLPDSCVLADSNHRAVGQAVENVIRNALKYNDGDQGLTITLERDSRQASLVIGDQGPGVAPDKLPHIFDPFFRANDSRSRESGGYGLGLALAKRQVQALGGSIAAHPNQPRGLRVTIVLPLAGVPVAM